MDGPFEYLNPITIETCVKNYLVEFEKTQKYYRNRIKQDMLGNPVLKFRVSINWYFIKKIVIIINNNFIYFETK